MGIKAKTIYAISFFITVSFIATTSFAQTSHSTGHTYDSLSVRHAELLRIQQVKQDSVADMRRLFGSDPAKREAYSAEIIKLESDLLRLRDTISLVSLQIKQIDAERVPNATAYTPARNPDAAKPYFVSADYIRNSLTAAQYSQLVNDQENERKVAGWLKDIRLNYDLLVGLDTVYVKSGGGEESDSLYVMIKRLSDSNNLIADSLSNEWMEIFDNKVYTYNYILDSRNETELLSEMEHEMRGLMAVAGEIRGKYMYDAVALYPLQKQLILSYETRIARHAGIVRAADSLAGVNRSLDPDIYYMAPVNTSEIIFIDYSDYRVTKTPVYNSANPIPDTKIFSAGTVYRVFVGAFSSPQPVSLFRNVSPISREIKADKRHYYYIGGYSTYAEAASAASKLKEHGFKNPRVVSWTDGVYNEKPSQNSTLKNNSGSAFRVEIRGREGTLPTEITHLVRNQAPGKEISRTMGENGDYLFIIILDNRTDAEKLAEAVRLASEELEVDVLALS